MNFISSWSGGKDSCLASYYLIQQGAKLIGIVNMHLDVPGQSLQTNFIRQQAKAIGVPCYIGDTKWTNYRANFISLVNQLKSDLKEKIDACAYGDIDLEEHFTWNKDICSDLDLQALMPLQNIPRKKIIHDFLDSGFKAKIIIVNRKFLDNSYLGRTIDDDLIRHFEKNGVDICGEGGEFHTAVFDGPSFCQPIEFPSTRMVTSGDYTYLDFQFGNSDL